MTQNQSARRFASHFGIYASPAQLPNVAAATFQNVNLSEGDIAYCDTVDAGLYLCIDATRGAAVWVSLGGAGGAAQAATPATIGYTAANFYEGADNIYRGSGTGTIISVMIMIRDVVGGSAVTQRIAGTRDGGNGWELSIQDGANSSEDPIVTFAFNTSAGLISLSATLNKPQSGSPADFAGNLPQGRLLLIHGLISDDGGGGLEGDLLINGQQVADQVVEGVATYTPSTEVFRVGADPALSPTAFANNLWILGVGLRIGESEGTDYTVAGLQQHTRRCMIDGHFSDLVAAGFADGFDIWHTSKDFASSFAGVVAPDPWVPEAGAGDLAKTGAVTSQDVPSTF